MTLIQKILRPKAERLVNYALRRQLNASGQGQYLFIASLPKSGSTFMAKALCNLTGYKYVDLSYAYERNDQNLYLPKLVDSYSYGSVTHQHVRATAANIELMNKFAIKPVITVRNIFDSVVSIRDHMFNEGFAFPTFYCNEKFEGLDKTTQYDQIIELGIPWYFNFYVSWHEAVVQNKIQALWLQYEEVIIDWVKALDTIQKFYKIEKTGQEIRSALDNTIGMRKDITRINKGIAGRGRDELTDSQKGKIISMSRFYPWIDFSMLGIESH